MPTSRSQFNSLGHRRLSIVLSAVILGLLLAAPSARAGDTQQFKKEKSKQAQSSSSAATAIQAPEKDIAKQTQPDKKSQSDKQKQSSPSDSKSLLSEQFNVIVTAPRTEIPLRLNPAATTVIETAVLRNLPRAVAIDEALKLVPGVKVDNQAAGERVHLSIRGQGILTERGTRGVRTIVDGIPLNDPSGFVWDFYDIDWALVDRIEVMRGPAAAFYGSGSSGGILNITTRDGGPGPVSARAFLSAGSYGFRKGQAEAGGTTGALNYRVSASALSGDGYRDHTGFDAKNVSAKFKLAASSAVKLTAVVGYTKFYNQNAEGLNLDWFSFDPATGRTWANPDAYSLAEYQRTPDAYRAMFGQLRVPFNEYQDTGRFTAGFSGTALLGGGFDLAFAAYVRATNYEEAVPSSIIHRSMGTPGLSLQANHRVSFGPLRNIVSVGVDAGRQTLDEYKRANLGDAVEGPDKISDQTMTQSGVGVFLLDRVELGERWGGSLSLRYDKVSNRLEDALRVGGIDLSGKKTFDRATGRLGVTYQASRDVGLYASWGTGFLPPATEELTNNPYAYGGFNMQLVPATSTGEEMGVRGRVGPTFVYDVALFHLATRHDFGRYRVTWRPLETFYGNVGSTKRYGLETSIAWYPLEPLAVRAAYTYSNFKYDTVRTLGAGETASGTWLPNSPAHQLYIDAEWRVMPLVTVGAALEHVSAWYLDATNRILGNGYGRTDPYTLVHLRVSRKFTVAGSPWELMLQGRNITGVRYYGFTEPDPDGNSYQPAPTAEWSIGLRMAIGQK